VEIPEMSMKIKQLKEQGFEIRRIAGKLGVSRLERTGNGNVHNTTKKRPAEVFKLEKQHLRPITKEISITSINSSITRTVRNDNTIMHDLGRASLSKICSQSEGFPVFFR